MNTPSIITSPEDPALAELCQQLSLRADQTDLSDAWPADQLKLCADYGVYQWFIPVELGGQGWTDADIYRGYLKLSGACLNTTFVITQLTGACRRIAAVGSESLRGELLPDLLAGRTFTTLGISHLTTSRQHLARPVLQAQETESGFVLDGFSPWVTGGVHAQTIVTGATLGDGRQILIVLPTDLPGVRAGEPARLVGLTAAATGPVHCENVEVPRRWLLSGPQENVMSGATGAATGGLQTSTLAIGLAAAAIEYLEQESTMRDELSAPAAGLRREYDQAKQDMLALATGGGDCSTQDLRTRANGLVLRASQAALTAAKGSGYVAGHPVGRWCREALFFLVWSCPAPVMAANLCELAGISD